MASLNEAFRDISLEDKRELQSLTPEENQHNLKRPVKGGAEGQVEGSAAGGGICEKELRENFSQCKYLKPIPQK